MAKVFGSITSYNSVPPSGINFSLDEIFEDVGYDVDWW